MENVHIEDIMQWTAADVVGILGTRSVVAGISTDTRTLRPGEVFLALAGGSFDGHDYVEEAFAAGAVAAIVWLECAPYERQESVAADA